MVRASPLELEGEPKSAHPRMEGVPCSLGAVLLCTVLIPFSYVPGVVQSTVLPRAGTSCPYLQEPKVMGRTPLEGAKDLGGGVSKTSLVRVGGDGRVCECPGHFWSSLSPRLGEAPRAGRLESQSGGDELVRTEGLLKGKAQVASAPREA